jgi:hypothetical protein
VRRAEVLAVDLQDATRPRLIRKVVVDGARNRLPVGVVDDQQRTRN